MLTFYNTLAGKKEPVQPINGKTVRMYACGPTVYDFAHIGNLRTYLFEDLLRRTLEYLGYNVLHVTNITDVGHLVSDADTGDDKMQKALAREKLPPTAHSLKTLADRYTEAFLADLDALRILRPQVMPKATDHVPQMIEMVQQLVERGFAYVTPLAVYFDVAKFPAYTQLSRQKLQEKAVGVRDEVEVDSGKRHPADFALWFKMAGKNVHHVMHWPSPWGEGFPGWHIECSAMSRQHLGFPFDIHCGGIDHIAVHHTNEIAQNECFFGASTVRIWSHGEFLDLGKTKMAKSAGTFIRLADVTARGVEPLAFRYLCLNTHYRQKLNFSWEALAAAQTGLDNLRERVLEIQAEAGGTVIADAQERFREALSDDLNAPKALGVVWEVMKGRALPRDRWATYQEFERVLALLPSGGVFVAVIPESVQVLAAKRQNARKNQVWEKADELRQQIEALGFFVEDAPDGPKLKPRRKG